MNNLKNIHARAMVLMQTHCLNMFYNCMKFRWNIFDGYQVIEPTWFCETDPQTEARGENIHARAMVLVHDMSSECALKMYIVSLK